MQNKENKHVLSLRQCTFRKCSHVHTFVWFILHWFRNYIIQFFRRWSRARIEEITTIFHEFKYYVRVRWTRHATHRIKCETRKKKKNKKQTHTIELGHLQKVNSWSFCQFYQLRFISTIGNGDFLIEKLQSLRTTHVRRSKNSFQLNFGDLYKKHIWKCTKSNVAFFRRLTTYECNMLASGRTKKKRRKNYENFRV